MSGIRLLVAAGIQPNAELARDVQRITLAPPGGGTVSLVQAGDRFRVEGLFDVAFRLEANQWNGTVAPQLVVRRIFVAPDSYTVFLSVTLLVGARPSARLRESGA